ncbi:hypothetical protein EDD17DRAFT_1530087 [Pisolithus thermaeus]|nr:hypothetical protein EDD17DRAFT_1530087 [Pisolithus thermaeus]
MSPCSLHTCTLLTLITSAPSGVFIPTQSRIQAAREKCEHLRVIHSEEDYISLAATTPTDTYQGPHRESRLTRQEDELGEGIDGTNTPSIRVRKKRSYSMIEASQRRDSMQEMTTDAMRSKKP